MTASERLKSLKHLQHYFRDYPGYFDEVLAAMEAHAAEAVAEVRNPADKIFSFKWLDPKCVECGCQSMAIAAEARHDERANLIAMLRGNSSVNSIRFFNSVGKAAVDCPPLWDAWPVEKRLEAALTAQRYCVVIADLLERAP